MILFVARISPDVPDAAVPTPKEPNCTLEEVATAWPILNVTAPVALLTETPVPATAEVTAPLDVKYPDGLLELYGVYPNPVVI